jgi:hypothetical protein
MGPRPDGEVHSFRIVFGGRCKPFKGMAGTTRLELATSAVTGQRSNQLNYVPAIVASAWKQLRTETADRSSRMQFPTTISRSQRVDNRVSQLNSDDKRRQ